MISTVNYFGRRWTLGEREPRRKAGWDFKTKKDFLAREITRKILGVEYLPGMRLKARYLVEEFNASEMMGREAIME